jgi:hypothetical protein
MVYYGAWLPQDGGLSTKFKNTLKLKSVTLCFVCEMEEYKLRRKRLGELLLYLLNVETHL